MIGLVQQPLFDDGPESIAVVDATVVLYRRFLPTHEADRLFYDLAHSTSVWRQDQIRIFGKTHDLPRLQQWYGESAYTYSGIRLQPLPWRSDLQRVRQMIEALTGVSFNSCLANLYRDGNDTVGWHADDEPELGESPTIASLSLGAQRDFVMRHKRHKDRKMTIALPHGSLLVMSGATQQNWEHALPRRAGVAEPRINLTFRRLV